MENLQEKLNQLDKNIGEIIILVVSAEKIGAASNLITKYTKEFYEKIKDEKDTKIIDESFGPFINNLMSVVEVLLGRKSPNFRSTRKLILNEMYNFKKEIIGGDKVDA